MKTGRFTSYAESKDVHHPVLRILFASGVGAVFGFQNWRLARYGFSLSLPWYGSALIIMTHSLLGLTLGMSGGGKHYWLRGVLLGLLFSMPTAFGAIRLELDWVPYGLAVLVSGTIAGVLIALINRRRLSRNRLSRSSVPVPATITGHSLARP